MVISHYPNETSRLLDGPIYHEDHYKNHAGIIRWNDPRLYKITRLQLKDFSVWDISYCYGILKDGRTCDVELPFFQVVKRKIQATIIKYARR